MSSLLSFCKSLTFAISIICILLFWLMEDQLWFIYLVQNDLVQKNAYNFFSFGTIFHIFAHKNMMHIVVNLFWFIPFSYYIERHIKSKFRYIVMILITTILSSILHCILFHNGLIPKPYSMGLSTIINMNMSFCMMGLLASFTKDVFARELKIFYTLLFFIGSFRIDVLGAIHRIKMLKSDALVEQYNYASRYIDTGFEMHIFGFLTGIVFYIIFRKQKRQPSNQDSEA